MNRNKRIVLCLSLLPFVYIVIQYIQLDFWNDEVYTLNHFTLVPLIDTITDYHAPNNHVFFNLINNLYLQLTGITDIRWLADHPFFIRIVSLLYAVGTLIYTYAAAKKRFNDYTAIIAVIILCSTITYYNFFLQVRGYGLSMFLLSMMIFHSLRYESEPAWKDFILIITAACLSSYTIPPNIYFVLSAGIFYFVSGIIHYLKTPKIILKEKDYSTWKYFGIVIALATGTILALLFYLPVYDQVFNNEFAKSFGWFKGSFVITNIIFCSFQSGRFLITLMALAGLLLYVIKRDVNKPGLINPFILLACIFLLPFVISYIRADYATDRSFVILAPVFALAMAIGIYFFISRIKLLKKHEYVMLFLLMIYCDMTFAFAYSANRSHIKHDIAISKRSQDVNHNYYLAYYHPEKLVDQFSQIYSKNPLTLLVLECDFYGIRAYLDKYGITYYDQSLRDSIVAHSGNFYVVANKPHEFEQWMKINHSNIKCNNLNPFVDFHNFFYCTVKATLQ